MDINSIINNINNSTSSSNKPINNKISNNNNSQLKKPEVIAKHKTEYTKNNNIEQKEKVTNIINNINNTNNTNKIKKPEDTINNTNKIKKPDDTNNINKIKKPEDTINNSNKIKKPEEKKDIKDTKEENVKNKIKNINTKINNYQIEKISINNNNNYKKNNSNKNNNSNNNTNSINNNSNNNNFNKNNNNNENINISKTEPNQPIETPKEILESPIPSPITNNIDLNNSFNSPNEPDQSTFTQSPPINSTSKKNKEIFLPKKLIPDSELNDTFCMGFFIASFNFNSPKVIPDSDELVADCGHEFCSSLQAIIPEIIARYPEKDNKDFEISDLGASICFPNGIKICFDKNEMHVNGLKNYSSMLTNQVGKRYYISTYHLYFKHSYEDFMKEYGYSNSIDMTLLEAMRIKYIYLPFCVCLLSKYPFFTQMEKCLESLRFTLMNNKISPNELYDLLIYLTKSFIFLYRIIPILLK